MSGARRAGVRALSGALVRTGAVSWLERRRRGRGDYGVFILEYHRVTDDDGEPEGTVTSARLRSHVQFLKKRFRVVSLGEAVAQLSACKTLDEDLAVITFDDGFRDNYELAWPVLRDEGTPATIFVTTGFVDGQELWFDQARRSLGALERSRGHVSTELARELEHALGGWPQPSVDASMERLKRTTPATRAELVRTLADAADPAEGPAHALTWDQVREMVASSDIEIGAHTVSHPILGQLGPQEQRDEVEGSRSRLEEETGVAPTLFAYPNGGADDFDQTTVERVHEAGFEAACSTIRGTNRPGCDPFALQRIGVGADTEDVLAARVGGLFDENVRKSLLGGLA